MRIEREHIIDQTNGDDLHFSCFNIDTFYTMTAQRSEERRRLSSSFNDSGFEVTLDMR
jgi:hypothetical protein